MSLSSLIAELEDAVKNGSRAKRVETLRRVANDAGREATSSRDFARSDSLVNELNRRGKLTEAALVGFVTERKYEEMTATLALFCGAKSELIERLLKNERHGGLIIACKAGKLTWPTVALILKAQFSHRSVSQEELDTAKRAFIELSQAAAQRSMRFLQVQEALKAAKRTGSGR